MQTFASLRRHRNYRLYFAGQLVSQVGTWLQTAAQSWLVLELTHSAVAVGVVGFCFYGPYAVLGLLGGALADRISRHRMMMATQGAMALCAVALALVVFLHVDRVWVIDLIAVIRGVVLVFNNPSRQALMVQLVGRGELANAIALNSGLNNATRIVGPGIAGILIATVGTGWCFALNAISYVAVILALGAMREDEFHATMAPPGGGSLWRSVVEGLRYARTTRTIAVLLTMLLVISLLAINFNVLLPVLANQTLHGGPQVYGAIAASFGAGAFLGALITASRARTSTRLVVASALGFGLTQVWLAFVHTELAAALALLVTGVCYTLYTASTNAIVQLASPDALQGRIGGLYSYVFLASGPFGALLVGWLCERGGTALAFAVAGAGTLVMVALGLMLRPGNMARVRTSS